MVIVGGGAAGIAACRRLRTARLIACCSKRARGSAGGRGRSATTRMLPIDLGCGWLHSADRNPWRQIAEAQGRSIDRTPPPWTRPSAPIGLPLAEQAAYLDAREKFFARVDAAAESEQDAAAATFLEPDGRWNDLLRATGTYVSGAELERVSVRDLGRYDDTRRELARGRGLRHRDRRPWRRPAGRARLSGPSASIGAAGDCAWRPRTVLIAADAAIVTLPSALLAEEKIAFTPAPAREGRCGGGPAARTGRQAVLVALRRRGIREG